MKSIFSNHLFGLAFVVLFLLQVVSAAGPGAVNLGTAGDFVILAKSGISTTGTTAITGDIGVSPIDSTAITGFGLILDSSTQYATSSLVTGKAYAANYSAPTPTKMTTAISDMETAYTDAAGRTNPTATELGAGNIDGMTIAPGLYKWGTGVTIPIGVTLAGSSTDVWIFQIGQDLTVGNGAIITLSEGAQAKNIFWIVAGQATLGTTSDFKGIILSQTAISMNTGATLNGRALAQTAVTLDASPVTAPSETTTPSPTPSPEPTPTPAPTPAPTPSPTQTPTGTSGTSTNPAPAPVITPTPTSTPITNAPTDSTGKVNLYTYGTDNYFAQERYNQGLSGITPTTYPTTTPPSNPAPSTPTGENSNTTAPQADSQGLFGLGDAGNLILPALIMLGLLLLIVGLADALGKKK